MHIRMRFRFIQTLSLIHNLPLGFHCNVVGYLLVQLPFTLRPVLHLSQHFFVLFLSLHLNIPIRHVDVV